MKEIYLTQNKICLVDDEDYEVLSSYNWYARKDLNTFYAQRKFKINGKFKNLMMHRIIMNPPDDMYVDHINRNGLDNRKSNLRIVNHSQNHFNEKLRIDNNSGYKGIYFNNSIKKWSVALGNKYIGSFHSKTSAIEARKEAELKYLNDF